MGVCVLLVVTAAAGSDAPPAPALLAYGWGDEAAVIDGYQRATEVDLAARRDANGRRVYLDGRFGGATRDRLQLLASDVRLISIGSAFDPSRFAGYGRGANLRVFGTATHDGVRATIDVDRVVRLLGDAERFSAVRKGLAGGDADARYALGDRLRARHRRYAAADPGSRYLTWAAEVTREAIEIDARQAEGLQGRPGADALYALAERTVNLLGDAGLRDRLLARALVRERDALPSNRPANLLALADKWDRLLPGRTEPARLRRLAFETEYRRLAPGDAQGRYRLAARCTEVLRDAGWAARLVREGLEIEAGALGKDDYDGRYRLSARVATRVGDAGWSRTLLKEGADVERAHLAGRPPTACFDLARRYAEDLGDTRTRDALMAEGLRVQEARLDARDLNGHFELAMATLASLGDRDACRERLLYCLTLVPDEQRVKDALRSLGLVEVAGRWYEHEAVRTDARLALAAAFEGAIAAGRIRAGMTPAHVRRAWGGPNRQDTAYTGSAQTIIWTYAGVRPTRVTFRNGRVVAWSR